MRAPTGCWGGDGDDILHGGEGADNLNGGRGSDSFRFAGLAEGANTISGFLASTDTIGLSTTLFGASPPISGMLDAALFEANARDRATDVDIRMIYNARSGALWFDADGNGAVPACRMQDTANISFGDFPSSPRSGLGRARFRGRALVLPEAPTFAATRALAQSPGPALGPKPRMRVTWPILRPGRASALPYRWRRAPGSARSAA